MVAPPPMHAYAHGPTLPPAPLPRPLAAREDEWQQLRGIFMGWAARTAGAAQLACCVARACTHAPSVQASWPLAIARRALD